ncbi:hypothetical protein [Streptomyces sp.]|uniref:hypothetical protein n=1 Tax=Streptomyces sp. TaxID=1931 RepID=UPI002810DF88|nr:hypothetical protein [Streptomyces sp.]
MDSPDRMTLRRPETGWSKARRLRGAAAPRTCLPAVEDRAAPAGAHSGPEWNIVRGED